MLKLESRNVFLSLRQYCLLAVQGLQVFFSDVTEILTVLDIVSAGFMVHGGTLSSILAAALLYASRGCGRMGLEHSLEPGKVQIGACTGHNQGRLPCPQLCWCGEERQEGNGTESVGLGWCGQLQGSKLLSGTQQGSVLRDAAHREVCDSIEQAPHPRRITAGT